MSTSGDTDSRRLAADNICWHNSGGFPCGKPSVKQVKTTTSDGKIAFTSYCAEHAQ